ncbi:MAG TPA: NUDIX domain-containing protein [Patescibacteria group bacterium]|jgi:ADP-ribose pyrophosphatase YjhB (NUDIX family)/predicted transcriptional regulator|nr:NUDIX domain-containing protein [Patescibacteria group bacterium]
MSVDKQLHQAHVAILRVLLFSPVARFAELQKASELTSDHFNFYLKQLSDEEYIGKNQDGAYRLTFKGKEFANRFDTDERKVERQPKVAVCLMIRHDGKQLVQQRLKQPYYGYWGRPTGKIRWGETILEAAARELAEETGLEADLQYEALYHKMDYNEQTSEMLEDKIFFVIGGTNPRGKLIEDFEGGHNAWMTQEEYANQEKTFEGTNDRFRDKHKMPMIPIAEAHYDYAPDHY